MDAEMDMEMDELWADGDDEYYEDEDESGGEYEDPVERMETDWGLSEGDTSSEGDSGYPLDELVDDDSESLYLLECSPCKTDCHLRI